MDLQLLWYVLVGVLLAGYALSDGYDLGAGTLYPFVARTDAERAAVRHSIGPWWDANEVWLLTGAGALFAAFPAVYATIFSGFYLALMLVLFALILRGVSIEFRSRDPEWAKVWDWGFFIGSALPALLFGVAAGNILRGVPLTPDGEFGGTFFTLLNPVALLAGVTWLTLFVAHGGTWLAMSTDGEVAARSGRIARVAYVVFGALAVLMLVVTATALPDRFANVVASPLGWLFSALVVTGVVVALVFSMRRASFSFLGTGTSAAGLVGLWAVADFPELVPALTGTALTIRNASSSQLTLTVMAIIAGVGVPIMLAYTGYVYWRMGVRVTEVSQQH